jgi:hypothetical protein
MIAGMDKLKRSLYILMHNKRCGKKNNRDDPFSILFIRG